MADHSDFIQFRNWAFQGGAQIEDIAELQSVPPLSGSPLLELYNQWVGIGKPSAPDLGISVKLLTQAGQPISRRDGQRVIPPSPFPATASVTGAQPPFRQLAPTATPPAPIGVPGVPAEEDGRGTVTIEVINGFNVIVRRDSDGNIIDMQVISPVGEGGPTAFQEAQLGQRREELAFERQRIIEGQRERQAAAFGRRVATPQDFSEKIRQIQSLAFEDAKAELLFNIGEGPRNQFIRERLKLEINPFIKPPGLSPRDQIAEIDFEEKRYKTILEDIQKSAADPNTPYNLNDPTIQGQVKTLNDILSSLAEQRTEVTQEILSPFEKGAELTGTSPGAFRARAIKFARNPNSQEFANLSSEENIALFGAGESAGFFDETQVKEKTGIAPPSIIQQFVPELKGQKFIPGTGTTPGTIPKFPAALSGQQFGRLTPTQLETIRGFQEFAGQTPADFEFQTAATIPKRPTLGKRQRPAFQVA